jgi:hypothetical protein
MERYESWIDRAKSSYELSKATISNNRVVQKLQFLNNNHLKNGKMRSILQDLFNNQPGY